MAKRWIQKAIKKPGSLRATAARMGLVREGENLSESDLRKMAKKGSSTTRRRVALARTLKKLRRKK